MTTAEQKRFDRLATAIRRICDYQTPKQLERSAGRAYGLPYCEALEYAYENMRNEAKAVESLVRPKRRKPPAAGEARSSGSVSTVNDAEKLRDVPSVGNTTTNQEQELTTRVDTSSFANSPIATTAGKD